METRGIETIYKGYKFRSKLEAQWAAMFDLLEWPWVYEPLDLDGYIPDFVLNFPKHPLLVEVKPEFQLEGMEKHREKIERSGWTSEYVIVGVSPLMLEEYWSPVLGLLCEYGYLEDEYFWPSAGVFFKCGKCKHYSVHHAEGSWFCRYSGCYDGDHYINHVEKHIIEQMWGEAHSKVRYDRNAQKANGVQYR